MNNTRWTLKSNGDYILYDFTSKIECVIMKITDRPDGTLYLHCPEMGYKGFDAHSRLESKTFTDAKEEAEGKYEEWLKRQVYYYNHRLDQLFGKTAICMLVPHTHEMYKILKERMNDSDDITRKN